MLTLTIKKKWFDMILSGEKKEEYREIKPYYDSRIMNAFGVIWVGNKLIKGQNVPEEIRKSEPVPVMFRNGYSSSSPYFIAYCNIRIGYGNPEWGAEPGHRYYILGIEIIEEVRK
jgi:hypothetical protein